MGTPREQLAELLKQSRMDAGYSSQSALAKAMHISRPAVSRAENPTAPIPSPGLLESWADTTGVALRKLTDLAARCRSGTPEWFMPYRQAESEATTIRCWSPMLVPGLQQTEAYARALIATEPYTPERLEELVAARMERQKVLDRVYLAAVIDQSVLERCMGTPQIMAEQCAHLLALVERPSISLHVVPKGRNVGLEGAFDIASRDGSYTVRMTTLQDVTSTKPDLVEHAMRSFERRLGAALGPDESLDFVREMEEQWKSQT